MLVPSVVYSKAELLTHWSVYEKIYENREKFKETPNDSYSMKEMIKEQLDGFDLITSDIDPTKISCDTPFVQHSIDYDEDTYNPKWGKNVCPQKEFLPTVYASILKHHLNQRKIYEGWWNKPCEVSTEEELRSAVALASGNKAIIGKFWNIFLNLEATCDAWEDKGVYSYIFFPVNCYDDSIPVGTTGDWNDIVFKPYTDEWWHAHICATEIVNSEGEKAHLDDVSPGDLEMLFADHGNKIIKKIIMTKDIDLKSPIIVSKDPIMIRSEKSRVFDIKITGKKIWNSTPRTYKNVSIIGDEFKGPSILIKNFLSRHVTISDLIFKDFSVPLIKSSDIYQINLTLVRNGFSNQSISPIEVHRTQPSQGVSIFQNYFIEENSSTIVTVNDAETITAECSKECEKLTFIREAKSPFPIEMAELYYNGSWVGLACSAAKKSSAAGYELRCTAILDEQEITTIQNETKVSISNTNGIKINEVVFHVAGGENSLVGPVVADVKLAEEYHEPAFAGGVVSATCVIPQVLIDGECQVCESGTVKDSNAAACICDAANGYGATSSGGCEKCSAKGDNWKFHAETGSCGCASGYVNIGGSCQIKIECDDSAHRLSATNECACKASSAHLVDDRSCECPEGKKFNPTKYKCIADVSYADDSSSVGGTLTVAGAKEAAERCTGEGQEYNGMLDRCTCVDGYFCGDDRDENDDCICEALKEDTCSGYIDSMSGLCVTGDTDKIPENGNISKRAGGDGCSLSDAPLSHQTAANLAPYLALFIILRLRNTGVRLR